MVVIIMGPAGAGKSTVGRALAAALGWRFHDADDFHLTASIAKMRQGIPLEDDERDPWLVRVRSAILIEIAAGRDAVVACSALRDRYRTLLAGGLDEVRFVYLQADPGLLRSRLQPILESDGDLRRADSRGGRRTEAS
jgi:gluconokinase